MPGHGILSVNLALSISIPPRSSKAAGDEGKVQARLSSRNLTQA